MKVIILAAGRGSRLAQKTKFLPKCMTKLWGKALIDWQIDVLLKTDIDEIGIVVGYQAQKIKQNNVHYFVNDNWSETSVLGSLLTARSWLEKYDCIIAYSDILYTPEIITAMLKSPKDIVLPYKTNFLTLWSQRFENPLIDLETFRLKDNQTNLKEIGDPAQNLREIEGQFMGLIKISPQGFKKIYKVLESLSLNSINTLDITGLLRILLQNNIEISTLPSDDFWLEVDTVDDLKLYESWNNPFQN